MQRGSVVDMPTYPGDPLTPGVGATKDAKRLALKDAATITKIPVLPISYADAEPLFRALGGQVVPERWRGGLPITYRFGPGPARVHMVVKSDWSLKPLYDVIARLPGTTEADQWVVRGNHHDAWVNGAEDPISGLVAELEEARALGALYKQGWRPRRTIVYAAWDGEEPGLLGSTEWAEAHESELASHAVAYLNTDSNGRGYLGVEGSHTLEKFITGVADDVEDPEAKVSVGRRARDGTVRTGLQHLGVASLNIGFGGEDDGGIYHSIYDDFYWYTHFSDTSFVYGRAVAQTVGLAVMRLASADLLPFAFTNLAQTAKEYATELEQLRDRRAGEITDRNRAIDDGVFAATSDPRAPTTAPAKLAVAPHLEIAPLLDALDSLQRSADRYERSYARWRDGNATTVDLPAINAELLRSERVLTSANGLPKRPWYRHLLYAPGYYTGYGVKTMPGAREAIEQGDWSDVGAELRRIAGVVEQEAAHVSRVAARLGGQ